MTSVDPHSYGRPSEARVRHVALDLDVDFRAHVLRGKATLDLDVADFARSLVLDSRRLHVDRVVDAAGRALAFSIGAHEPVLGAPLTVELPRGTTRVAITYRTHADAEALEWLDPVQTAGGAHPFLFTQGHAIQTRSWIPLQDSPRVRVTYEARITVPRELVAVMSAEHLGGAPAGDEERSTFTFRMAEPIPPYLIALAVGDLATRAIGPRTAVFAEPSWIERAAHELGEAERMIDAAEALGGPYRWGRFDVVIMPPSFPYGGMENPRLTFASPSIIVGDRSLTTLVAHELAHAWAGNLVTNATWNDFWINEGTTVYLELRIHEVLWGATRARMLHTWGYRELVAEIERVGTSSPDTRLAYDMTGRDPAVGVTIIPYLKGAAFFWTIENRVGRPRLDRWLRGWFDRRAFQSVTTAELLADLRAELFTPADEPIDLEAWVSTPGVPDAAPPPPSELLDRVDAAAKALAAGTAPGAIDTRGWTPHAFRQLLGALLASPPPLAQLDALDAAFGLSASTNCEVTLPWLRLLVKLRGERAAAPVEAFLRSQGRARYLRPLYADLLEAPWGSAFAKRVYAEARPAYHALVRAALDALLGAPA
ncbi:MAG: M1 family metallopeptidase [Polyangiaceae bacterium]